MNLTETNLQSWQIALLVVGLVWELGWRGVALWRAARNNQTKWFIVLLVVNTVGILPIFYLLTNKADATH